MKKLVACLPFVALFALPLLLYPVVDASGWLSSSDMHSTLEFAASLLAVTAGIMILLHYFSTGRLFFLIISMGFVLIGTEEFVHAIFSLNRIWPEILPSFKYTISSTWLTGRYLLAASFIGALFFRKRETAPTQRVRVSVIYAIISIVTAGLLTLTIFSFPSLPDLVKLCSVTKILFELSLALVFFIAFLFYLNLYLKQQPRSPLLWSIVACIIFQVLVHIFVFNAQAFYDAHFDAAHLLVVLSYFFPIFGVWGETLQLQKTSQLQVTELEKATTERSRVEEELQSNHRMLARTEGITHIGSWEWDIATDTVTWSEELFRIFQMDPHEGAPSFAVQPALYHPDDMARLRQCVEVAIADGTPYELEMRAIRKDGETRICIARGVADGGQGKRPTRLFGSLQDITDRKKTEEQYRLLAENAADVIYTLDIVTDRYSYVSPSVERLLGYTLSESLSLKIKDLLTPDSYQKQHQAMMKDISGAATNTASLQLDVIHKDGHLVPVEINARFVRDMNGNPVTIVGVLRDITERKKAEEEIAKEEMRYRSLINGIPGIVYSFSPKRGGVYYSPQVTKILGYSPEQMLAQPKLWNNSIHTDDLPHVEQAIREAELGKSFQVEYRIRDASGNWRWLLDRSFSYRDSDGDRIIEVLAVDITPRKQMERELAHIADLLERTSNMAKVGGWEFDVGTNRLVWSVETYRIHEVDLSVKADVASAQSFYTPEMQEKLRAMVQAALDHGTPWNYECPMTTTKGRAIWVRGEGFAELKNGKTIFLRGTFQDITDRKQAEVENLRLREKAEMSSRLAAIGEMAAGIAHEINNPLTGVIGFSELLADRQDLPADVQEELKIISGGGNRVKDIVRRMLTFARQNKPVKASANINELIDNTLEIRSYVLRTANIEVIRNYDPSLPWVTVDPGQMQQVFLNLIVNAEYAMKKAHGKGTLVITTEKNDGHISISFKDDGMGMSQETKAKVFNPFFTTKQVNEGTGLGLSLSRSIILEHDGTIEVESEPGQGTTFIITLPVTPADEGKAPELTVDSQTSPENFKSARILVVDDEEGIRKLVSTILVKSGHVVDVTGDSVDAFEKLGSNTYDVIICDIRIPGMSGMEVYKLTLEAHPELTGKFIFITGDTSDETTRVFLEKNKLTYVTKPFDKNNLMKKVQELL